MISDIRREYASRSLGEADTDPDPITQFRLWFDEALRSQVFDANAIQAQRHRLQPAQFDPGVLVDHLVERQHEQPRRITSRQPAQAGDLHIVDERAERQAAQRRG